MGSFLSEVKGFTPVIDVLAKELGLMTAVVYGIVWRYCQMEDKVCKASCETIANHAGISMRTVERHLQKLCNAGYLKDLTPTWRHRPHTYADTGKAKIKGLLTVEVGTTESRTSTESGMTESSGVRQRVVPRYDKESDLGTTESPIKRLSYENTDDTEKRESLPPSKKADPLSFDLDRKTEVAQAQNGNSAVPVEAGGSDRVAEAALNAYYQHVVKGEPPERSSGTWVDEVGIFGRALHDHRITDPQVAARAMKLMARDYTGKDRRFLNPHFKSFNSLFSGYVAKAKAKPEEEEEDWWPEEEIAPVEVTKPTPAPKDVWQKALDELQGQMPKATFDTWLRDTTLVSSEDGTVTVACPSDEAVHWLNDRAKSTGERVLVGITGGRKELKFVVCSNVETC